MIKKILIYLALMLSVCAISFGCYFVIKSNTTNNETKNKELKPSEEFLRIFPLVDAKYFQDYLLEDGDGSFYINTEIIDKLVEDISRRVSTYDGHLYFDYEIVSKQQILIHFLFAHQNGQKLTQSYNIHI
ncbi:MHO_1590 family protein [Mycoplasmopsis gallinacea]|uniref:Lipoprotein n=1 Tax=Mycoplasmopsis gallinacea TaxID=29556 RepID=A0A449A3F0_9BACT|nr:hypothetical protein [Mycoplasmopsis gallinacea]VEU58775.1 Uncharacterised protein [Mycoplasmopsis gallinacea]